MNWSCYKLKAFNKKIKPKHVTKTKYKPYEIRRKGKTVIRYDVGIIHNIKKQSNFTKIGFIFFKFIKKVKI